MIGQRLINLRVEIEMTQTAVALALNMTPGSYSLYENDKRSPDYETLKKIADFYNVSMAYILGETNNRAPLHLYDKSELATKVQELPEFGIYQNYQKLIPEDKNIVKVLIRHLLSKY